ncbi:MAG TPA: DUF4157 domain-containing protein [Waterburya sp.]
MTSQRIRINQPSKSDMPLVNDLFQRAAVHSVSEKEVQPTEDTEPIAFRESCFHHDFSRVPVHSTTPIIQPRLRIGAVGDRYEQEAERVAPQVVAQMNKPGEATLQREEMPETDDDEEKPMRKPLVQRQSDGGEIAATSELETSLQQARGSGQPLLENVRRPMERAFACDFSQVKVHTDARSDRLNRSIQAEAFTTGQDVFFRQGVYEPRSRRGQELIAHELTHVVQQNGSVLQGSLRGPAPTLPPSVIQRVTRTDFDSPIDWRVFDKQVRSWLGAVFKLGIQQLNSQVSALGKQQAQLLLQIFRHPNRDSLAINPKDLLKIHKLDYLNGLLRDLRQPTSAAPASDEASQVEEDISDTSSEASPEVEEALPKDEEIPKIQLPSNIAELSFRETTQYLNLIQTGRLKVTTQQFVALSRQKQALAPKQPPSEREQLAAANVRAMTLANTVTKEGGVFYQHNLSQETLTALTQVSARHHDPRLADARTGYANPDYFEKIANFTWRVRPRVSASAAIRAFLTPLGYTVTECGTVIQAVNYFSILEAVGDRNFDQMFGAADQDTPDGQRLLLQLNIDKKAEGGKNPLGKFFEPESALASEQEQAELRRAKGSLSNAPGFRPAQLGGWYYIKNHQLYITRHPEGIWGGENAVYVGRDPKTGEQLFSGFGLVNRTERQMAQSLADEFNSPPSESEVEKICAKGFQSLPLALPDLGDPTSARKMPMNDRIMATIQKFWDAAKPGEPYPYLNQALAIYPDAARFMIYLLLKDQPLIPSVKPIDLLLTLNLSDLDRQVQGGESYGTWTTGETEAGEPCAILTWSSKQTAIAKNRSLENPYGQISVGFLFSRYFAKYLLATVPSAASEKAFLELFSRFNPRLGAKVVKGTIIKLQGKDLFYFPLPSEFHKIYKTPGGFQSMGERTLSPGKIKEKAGITALFEGSPVQTGTSGESASVPIPEELARINDILGQRGRGILETVEDGDCLYDAIRQQLLEEDGTDVDIDTLRERMVQLVAENQQHFADFTEEGVDELIDQISQVRSWDNDGGDIAAEMIATILQRNVIVISPNGVDIRRPNQTLHTSVQSTIAGTGTPLTIVYNGRDHYLSTFRL